MSIATYDKGDVVRCAGVFADSRSGDLDPDAVFFSLISPSGSLVTYEYSRDLELVRDSIGNYYVDVDADEEGEYSWRMYSTGSGKAAAEGQFVVAPSAF